MKLPQRILDHAEIVCPTTDRPAWLRARRTGITASDVSAILGLDDAYGTAATVLASKLSDAEPSEKEAFYLGAGHIMETPIIQLAQLAGIVPDGEIVQMPLLRSKRMPWLMSSCDPGILSVGCQWTQCECKLVGWRNRDQWGERYSDLMPERVRTQAAVQRMVTGEPEIVVLAYTGDTTEPSPFYYRPDAEFENALEIGLKAWWDRHVVNREPLPLDGEPETTKALYYSVGKAAGKDKVWADGENDELVREVFASKAALEEAERRFELAKQKAILAIGEGYGLQHSLGSVIYFNVAERKQPRWKGVAEAALELLPEKTRAELMEAHQTVIAARRDFKATPKAA